MIKNEWKMEKVQWSEIERKTEKAMKIGISRSGSFADVWVPNSLVKNFVSEGSHGTLELPVWFLIKNGF